MQRFGWLAVTAFLILSAAFDEAAAGCPDTRDAQVAPWRPQWYPPPKFIGSRTTADGLECTFDYVDYKWCNRFKVKEQRCYGKDSRTGLCIERCTVVAPPDGPVAKPDRRPSPSAKPAPSAAGRTLRPSTVAYYELYVSGACFNDAVNEEMRCRDDCLRRYPSRGGGGAHPAHTACFPSCQAVFDRKDKICWSSFAAEHGLIDGASAQPATPAPTAPPPPPVAAVAPAPAPSRAVTPKPPSASPQTAPSAPPATSREADCSIDAVAARIEASLTLGDMMRVADDMGRRRLTGCAPAQGGASPGAAANPFVVRRGSYGYGRPPGARAATKLPVELEPDPPAHPTETEPSVDCLSLNDQFTLSGIGHCLKYMIRNHPGQGQALALDGIDRALARELGKDGLYVKP